jgi:hypothetical protein
VAFKDSDTRLASERPKGESNKKIKPEKSNFRAVALAENSNMFPTLLPLSWDKLNQKDLAIYGMHCASPNSEFSYVSQTPLDRRALELTYPQIAARGCTSGRIVPDDFKFWHRDAKMFERLFPRQSSYRFPGRNMVSPLSRYDS